MAFYFNTTDEKFFLEVRNGVDFDQNTSDYTTYLCGNSGDRVKRTETVEIEIVYNKEYIHTVNYDSTGSSAVITATGTNFVTEGIFIGATVDVFLGETEIGESTIEGISGDGFSILTLDKTNLGAIADGSIDDLNIWVQDYPTRSEFKYGLIRSDVVSTSEDNYNSILDGNPQKYYKHSGLSGSLADMTKFGTFNSWNKTESIQISYDGTSTYTHTYTIEHVFRIGHYVDGEFDNLDTLVPPERLASDYTLKYASQIRLGFAADMMGQVDRLGLTGDVGYFDENYNGKTNTYTISSVSYSNSIDSGTIDNDNDTTVTVNITGTESTFVQPQDLVVGFSILPYESNYENNTDTYPEQFLLDSIFITAGAAADSSDILQDVTATYNDPDDMDVEFTIQFDDTQRELIAEGVRFVWWITIGENGVDVALEDYVNLRYLGTFSIDDRAHGLVTTYSPLYTDSFATFGGDREYTNHAGWDTDFVGFKTAFYLTQYTDGMTEIKSMRSEVIAVNQSDETDFFLIDSYAMPVLSDGSVEGSGYTYQIINQDINPYLFTPTDIAQNEASVYSVPPFVGANQGFVVRHSFRINWRDYIANDAVPTSFYDDAEPNNNRNKKTSNYSDTGGYDIYHRLLVDIKRTVETYLPVLDLTGITSNTYTYELRSDPFEVSELDNDPNGDFASCEIEFYDLLDVEVDILPSDSPIKLKCIFNHTLGTLSTQDLWGEIIAIKSDGTGEAFWLHTDKDISSITASPLLPSQEVSASNEQYVEIESASNEVVLWCQTNPANINPTESWDFFARLGKKTVTPT